MRKRYSTFSILFFFIVFLFVANNSFGKTEEKYRVINRASVKIGDNSENISNEVITWIDYYALDRDNLILIEKKADRDKMRVGELVKYKITIGNRFQESDKSDSDDEIEGLEGDKEDNKEDEKNEGKIDDRLIYIVLTDWLPPGFVYLPDSFKISSGFEIELENNGKNSGKFSFKIKVIDEEEVKKQREIEITYVARAGATAKLGENINYVEAIAYGENAYYRSNRALAEVELISDLFSLKGIIVGKVFYDSDGDGIFNEEGDYPIPGAKIYLENGDFAITDRRGNYSIYGENAITHVARIERNSVPSGAKMMPLSNRYSEKGDSLFVDLKTGELHKANFAFRDGDALFIEKIKARKEIFKDLPTELENILSSSNLEFENKDPGENRLNREGMIGGKIPHQFKDHEVKLDKNPSLKEQEAEERERKRGQSKEDSIGKLLPTLNNRLDFIDLKDGDFVTNPFHFQMKSPITGRVDVYINEEKVPESKIGVKASSPNNKLYFAEYIGVELKEGKNKLHLRFYDESDIERERKIIYVTLPGEFHDFVMEIPEDNNSYTSSSQPLRVKFKALDKAGNRPIKTVYGTIDSPFGTWITQDLNPTQEGIQFMTNSMGEAELLYLPPTGAKNITLDVEAEKVSKKIVLPITRGTAPMEINGIIEGRMNFSKKAGSGDYIFENSLTSYKNFGNSTLSYRGAFIAKGDITEEYHMIMAYDTNDEDKKYFAYRNPDEFYPIYGDNSIKGYEAESISKLYLRIDGNRGHFLYGDYETNEWSPQNLQLSGYSRALNGGIFRYEDQNWSGGGFISQTTSQLFVEEFQGEGISGPYDLSNKNILEGSEQLEIIIYERGNPNAIVETKSLTRGIDYTIDYYTGTIYFATPIPGTDLEFNPIYVKVSYSVEDEFGESHWIYGGDLTYKVGESSSIGVNFVRDEHVIDSFNLYGVNSKMELWGNQILFEGAKSENSDYESGTGYSIIHRYGSEKFRVENIYYDVSEKFDNPGAVLKTGMRGFEHKSEIYLTENSIGKLDAKQIKDIKADKEEREIFAGIQHRLSQNVDLEFGVRHFSSDTSGVEKNSGDDKDQDKGAGEKDNITSVAGKVRWNPQSLKSFSTFGEYEQDIRDSNLNRAGLGAQYNIIDGTRLYGRQELFSNMGRDFALSPTDGSNRTVFGMETDYLPIGKVFSEYRLKKEGDEKLAPEMSSGVKRDWKIGEATKLYTTFERITPLLRGDEKEAKKSESALTFGYDVVIDEKSKTLGDFEFAFAENNKFLSRVGYGRQISESISFFGKNRYSYEENNLIQSRTIFGIAYRDMKNDRFNGLFKYEFNYEDDMDDEVYRAHIIMNSNNYQISKKTVSTLSFSGKYIDEKLGDYKNSYFGYLIRTGVTHDLTEKIDMGLNMALLADGDMTQYKYGMGIEIGYKLPKDIWLSTGYNFLGVSDRYLDPAGDARKGFYLRFRMKLSEELVKFAVKK